MGLKSGRIEPIFVLLKTIRKGAEKSTQSEAIKRRFYQLFSQSIQRNEGGLTKKKLDIYDKMLLAATAWLLTLLMLHCAGMRVLLVRGHSMQPLIYEGALIVGRTVTDTSSLGRGDVITFHPFHSTGVTYIKRIVALPGEMVEARNDILLVNGEDVGLSCIGTGTWGPTVVGDGCLFVLGDNRSCSIDSRIFGAVPVEHVVARVIT